MIGLVDGNNFFVSCERVFNRRLVGRPVAVLSNNNGCCVSRSNEFKALGIPMGTPYFQLKHREASGELCFCSSNYELYGDMSRRIISILREEAVGQKRVTLYPFSAEVGGGHPSEAGRQGDRPRARRTAPQVRLARVPDALNRNGRSGGPQNASDLSPSASRRVACRALNRRCRRVSSRKTDCKCPRRLGAAETRGAFVIRASAARITNDRFFAQAGCRRQCGCDGPG